MRTRPAASGETGAPGPGDPDAAGPQAQDRDQATAPGKLRSGLWYCVKVFLGMRILLSVLALASVAVLPDFSHVDVSKIPASIRAQIPTAPGPVGVPGWPARATTPGWHNLVTSWERFDGLWYLRIAATGYRDGDGSAAFFPLYPLAIRAVSPALGGHPLAAALLVSNAAFLGALMVLFVLTRSELSDDLARRAVLYTAVFPTAFFFLAPYSESLFLLLVLTSFWAARRSRWEIAGVAGALAALTRSVGLLLVLPLAVEAVHQSIESRSRKVPIRGLAWSLGPLAGALSYLWFWGAKSGDWLAPLHQQGNWQRHFEAFVITLGKGTHEALRWVGIYPGGYHLLDWLIAVPVLIAALYAAWKFRPTYGVYVWASILVPLSFIFAPRPLMSFPRFALPLFPVMWAVARWTERSRVRHELVVAVSATLLGLLLVLFANWYYIF